MSGRRDARPLAAPRGRFWSISRDFERDRERGVSAAPRLSIHSQPACRSSPPPLPTVQALARPHKAIPPCSGVLSTTWSKGPRRAAPKRPPTPPCCSPSDSPDHSQPSGSPAIVHDCPKLASTDRCCRLPSSFAPRFHRQPDADGRPSLSLHRRSAALVQLFFTIDKASESALDELAARDTLSRLMLRAVSRAGQVVLHVHCKRETTASRVVGAWPSTTWPRPGRWMGSGGPARSSAAPEKERVHGPPMSTDRAHRPGGSAFSEKHPPRLPVGHARP